MGTRFEFAHQFQCKEPQSMNTETNSTLWLRAEADRYEKLCAIFDEEPDAENKAHVAKLRAIADEILSLKSFCLEERKKHNALKDLVGASRARVAEVKANGGAASKTGVKTGGGFFRAWF